VYLSNTPRIQAIITDTPEKQSIEKAYKKTKETGREKTKKKATNKKILVSIPEESDVPVPIDNVSDREREL